MRLDLPRDLEVALLELVRQGQGEYSWYSIASRLTRMNVPRQPDAMAALKQLVEDGLLVRETQQGSARDHWRITEAGIVRLAMLGGGG